MPCLISSRLVFNPRMFFLMCIENAKRLGKEEEVSFLKVPTEEELI